MFTKTQAAFFEKVHPEPNSGCWLWARSISGPGYGNFTEKRKVYYAHRRSYELFCGKITRGLYVCHKCDTKICVNPDHLFLGTQRDNMRDALRKGISLTPKTIYYGANHHNAKLTIKNVRFIRKSPLSSYKLAAKFNVSPSTIQAIRKGAHWSTQL